MQKLFDTDTITALATPSGRGGVAVIRVSGPNVPAIIKGILGTSLLPRKASFLPFKDACNQIIDEGIALYFPNPHSFTGEDILELQGHGGPVIVDMLLQRILQLGARLARPGEFSERAFLNGKIDLTQAEAIADLIDASSANAARLALRSLQGNFSRDVNKLNERIIALRTQLEVGIDFAAEEINFLNHTHLSELLLAIIQQLENIQHNAKQGSFLREGITAVIVGAPNVGKSSLLNRLSGKDIAIVTDIPGTTRDVLRDYVLIDDMPMHIVDTAGLRETSDIIEQEGIRRAYDAVQQADLMLYMLDARSEFPSDLSSLPISLDSQKCIFIQNKIDLLNEIKTPVLTEDTTQTVVAISAKTGEGIDNLKSRIKAVVGFISDTQGLYLARRRHLDALVRAGVSLNDAYSQLQQSSFGELAAEDLRQAHLALSEITGQFSTEDLLGNIFSSFCIGK